MTLCVYTFRIMKNNFSTRVVTIVICAIVIYMLGSSSLRQLLFSQRTQRSTEYTLPSRYLAKNKHFDYKKAMEILNDAKVQDDDLKLIALIKNYYIENPSTRPYNFDEPDKMDQSKGQTAVIDKLLNQKEDGFFVECGANSGEKLSNSLFLERYRNWDGILIEANPIVYKMLKKKNRKSYSLNACLNIKPYPAMVAFLEDSWWSKMFDGNYSKSYKEKGGAGRFIKVQCFPLYSILLALNQTRVDYFSLDVEGTEKGVLDSIPWDKVDIRTMSIEFNKWSGGKSSLIAYMARRGYKAVSEIDTDKAHDIIFLRLYRLNLIQEKMNNETKFEWHDQKYQNSFRSVLYVKLNNEGKTSPTIVAR